MIFLYSLATTLETAISAIILLMFARSILSFIMFDIEENRLLGILYAITDAVCAPMRFICDRMGWFQGSPIDFPHMITFILLIVLRALIPEIYI